MAQTEFQLFDRIQFDIGRLEDLVKALSARVTALESGNPLRQDQEIIPVPQPEAVAVQAQPVIIQPQTQPTSTPDIAEGWTASRRG